MCISLAAAALVAATIASPAMALGSTDNDDTTPPEGIAFGVIGDVPYGDAEIAAFPSYVDDLNAHSELSFVGHLGDIKTGSSACTDDYFATIKAAFDRFTLPLVYTPGDNEWTDCHRANNGTYDPLERLAAVRDVFFPKPGTTLGAPMSVSSQSRQGYPENVNFRTGNVTITALDIPGSNNSLAPWSGLGNTSATPEQLDEVDKRTKADIRQLQLAFKDARKHGDTSVVVLTQADMFDPTVPNPDPANYSGYLPLVTALIEESNGFDGPVYLINGDSHVFNQDHPLAEGSPWLSFYDQPAPATNLTRVTVDGSENAQDWLKVSSDGAHGTSTLSFERVPFTHPAH